MMYPVKGALLYTLVPSCGLLCACLEDLPPIPTPDERPEQRDLAAPAPRPARPSLRPPTLFPEVAESGEEVPLRLSLTGLYSSIRDRRLANGVFSFRPQYELWSDGADKTRFALFPPGSKIDTSSMDRWQFPVGVKFWKEFRRDGKLLETRLIWKTRDARGDVVWRMVPYLWNVEETEAYRVQEGAEDVKGTGHAVPTEKQCQSCHTYSVERPIGFSAIQLSGAGSGVRLKDLVEQGLLTNAPPSPDGYALPGEPTARAALGYLHANCGGCHATDVDLMAGVDMALRLEVGKLGSVAATPTYTTTRNRLTTSLKGGMRGVMARIKPGVPTDSAIWFRMGIRFRHSESLQMPPHGTDLVDEAGRAAVAAWIASLPP